MLLLCNFGDRAYLDVLGRSLGPAPGAAAPDGLLHRRLRHRRAARPARQLRRLALRPLLGLARAGSYASEGSGEIGMAFSTSRPRRQGRVTRSGDRATADPLFAAAYEAAHEAVLNCLVAARPAERLDGTMQEAFPVDAGPRLAGGAPAMADPALARRRSSACSATLIRIDTSNPPGQRDAGRRAARRAT